MKNRQPPTQLEISENAFNQVALNGAQFSSVSCAVECMKNLVLKKIPSYDILYWSILCFLTIVSHHSYQDIAAFQDNILVHSRSRAVLEVLKAAAKANKNFTVYVTESLPDRKG